MHFQILKLVLWPRAGGKPRVVPFVPGMVNVITGASKTGKSAVIPIIDYCLASKQCAIPVGVIRKKCAWFGIVVDTPEGQKLLARKEPQEQQSTGEMFILEAVEVEAPEVIEQGNTNDGAVRTILDRLAGLTQLDIEVDSDNGFKGRPSFRDMTSLIFQPQNIVANPNVLFYKADTTEHREKLKSVLPYVLGAITPRTIALRHEAEQVTRQLRKLESELRSLKAVSTRRVAEGRIWLRQARELGLTSKDEVPEQWSDILAQLHDMAGQVRPAAAANLSGIDNTLKALSELRTREEALAADASTNRQRLMEIRRLREGSHEYAGALVVQRERLALSSWMREELDKRHDAQVLFSSQTGASLDQLSLALSEVEGKLQAHPLATTSLDAEYLRQRIAVEGVLSELAAIRQEIRAYEANSDAAHEEINRTASAERFLGGLQQLLRQFAEADGSSDLEAKVAELQQQLAKIQAEIQELSIQRRLDSILNEIQQITGSMTPFLNVEGSDAPVRLNTKELTVQISQDGRNDFLWEVGSGANWLAYHVAITLALQVYFVRHRPSPVPSLLVYDQPSQVYFPTVTSADKDVKLTDQEDILAVRQIFKVMGDQVVAAEGRLQIIVLDHANKDVWGHLPGITLVEEWRGKKLVPVDW